MTESQLLQIIQRFVAEATIGPSTLRGQGVPGVLKAARRFLTKLDMRRVSVANPHTFEKRLNKYTHLLVRRLPPGAKHWGVARKAINLFLRDAYYNQFLARKYRLNRIARHLEIPLDAVVTRRLRELAGRSRLPQWRGLKGLTPADSAAYQQFVVQLARRERVHPVHLDAALWSLGRSGGRGLTGR
jgi:hypothetical protein